MTPAEIAALSEACDALLREPGADPMRMAVPLLHFRSAHPEALSVHDPARNQPVDLGALRRQAIRVLDRLLGARPALGLELSPERVDVLFISHLTSAAQAAGEGPDVYFGDLPDRLLSAGLSSLVALIDHSATSVGPHAWDAAARPDGVHRVLLSRRLGRVEEARIDHRLAAVARDLVSGRDHADLRLRAAREARSGSARQVLRISSQVSRLAARLRPRALVLTYEGHAWERIAMQQARLAFPGLRCIAVHHAILAPMQHAMLRRYGEGLDPDVILSAGVPAFDWLRAAPSLSDLPIGILGSPRAILAPAAPARGGKGATCLFLPEGLPGESLLLARLALDLSRLRPDLTCLIRLHPLTDRATLTARAPELGSTPPNLVWSPRGRPIAEDTSASRWAVYRGSSAILAAAADGVEPVYFGCEDAALRIDPMRGREGFGIEASTATALAGLLQPGNYDAEARARAIAYARNYYTSPDPDVLLAAIEGRRLDPERRTDP